MVIKGSARGNPTGLAEHLKRDDTNERVEIREMRGVAADDLAGALKEMDALGSALNTDRTLYHASINVRADELMTDAQWTRAIDLLEEKLGLTGQPRVVIEHGKKGREHVHVVWSRTDLEHMRAIRCDHNYRTHELAARELEREFGHARVQGVHVERDGPDGERVKRPDRTPSHAAMMQAERNGLSPQDARAWITTLWRATDSGKAFEAALESQGWTLARGDRRDFVVLDRDGGIHSLSRMVEGATAKDVRARMADVDRDKLLSVRDARGALRDARQADRAAEKLRKRPSSEVEIKVFTAHRGNTNDKAFVAELAEKGLTLAQATAPDLMALGAIREAMAVHDYRHGMRYAPPAVGLGELVAVNRWGGIHRLDPGRIPVQEIEQRFAKVKLNPPSIVEARAAYEIEREGKTKERHERAIDRGAQSIETQRQRTPQMTPKAIDKRSAARGAGKVLDGAAKTVGSLLDFIGNAFAPSPDASPRSQEKETQPVATPEPSRQTPHANAARQEEQQRAQRMQELVAKYGIAVSPEMERDAELRPGRERER